MKQKVSDNQQRISIALGFGLEVYRALMAAFLIAFVPQSCGSDGSVGKSCGVTDNLFTGSDSGYLAASSLNVITFAVFMYLYYVEISRENKMISYLEMNRELPKDNESVGEALVAIGDDKVAELHLLDAKYRHAGYGAMANPWASPSSSTPSSYSASPSPSAKHLHFSCVINSCSLSSLTPTS